MVYLTAAIVLVGLLCLLDLILTVGVIRRLREHSALLGKLPSRRSEPDLGVPVGETVNEFTAITTRGDEVAREKLSGRTLVGFFTPGCQPCSEQLPKFVERAVSVPGGTDRVLAVVVGGADGAEYTEQLSPVAKVVLEELNGPVQAAFRVYSYPAFFLVDASGVVSANAFSTDDLEEAAVPEPAGESA